MTAKEFFKSTGFRSVIVLLCIALISSFLLTVLHYVWPAADVTMDMGVVKDMYDNKSANFTAVELVEDSATNDTYGNVIGVVSADDGGYVILAKGKGGYGNSGVGMYVAIREGAIISVAIGDKGGETYWDRVEGSDLMENYKGKEISQEIPLTSDINLPAGNAGASAPMTSEAIWRAVNMAAWYAREVLKLGENVDAKSQEAIKKLEGYENSVLKTVQTSNFDSAALAVEGATFMMVYTVDGNKEAYVYKVGNEYCAYIVDNATRQILAKTAGVDSTVDTAITTLIAGFNTYGATVSNVALIVNGTSYVYELTAKSVAGGMPNDYRLRVTVENGAIADFVVLVEGATDGYENGTLWKDDDTVFDGKDEAGLDGINVSTGATNSNKTVMNALKYCLKDYAISVALGEAGENVNALCYGAVFALDGYDQSKLTQLTLSEQELQQLAVEGASFKNAYTVDSGKEAYVYKANGVYVAYIVNSADRTILAKTQGVETTVDGAIVTAIQQINAYASHVRDVTKSGEGTTLVYELYAISVASGMPNDYKLRVTVTNGQIASFEVLEDGATEGFGSNTAWNGNNNVFNGKDEAGLNGINITTGATNSNKTVMNALKYCLRDYAISQVAGNQ